MELITIDSEQLSVIQKRYFAFLNELIEKKETMLFTNSGKEHAEVLMYKIFEKTENNLNIYARGLLPELTDSPIYRLGLAHLISKNVTINVLLETDETKETPSSTLNYLLSQKSDNINCRVLKPGAFDKIQEYFIGYKHCNFCVADNKIFRYEINPEKFEAIGSFDSNQTSIALMGIFNKFFDDVHSIRVN